MALPDDRFVVFTCLWSEAEDGEGYPDRVITICTSSAVRLAGMAGLNQAALPLIGGNKRSARKPAMGRGLQRALALLERHEHDIEVIVATGASVQSR